MVAYALEYPMDSKAYYDTQPDIFTFNFLGYSGNFQLKIYEKAPEILKVQGSVIGTLGNFRASIGKAKSKKTFNVSAIVAASLKNGTVPVCIYNSLCCLHLFFCILYRLVKVLK